MTRAELLQEREYWIRMNTDWALTQVFTRQMEMTESFSLTTEAIMTNRETIDLTLASIERAR